MKFKRIAQYLLLTGSLFFASCTSRQSEEPAIAAVPNIVVATATATATANPAAPFDAATVPATAILSPLPTQVVSSANNATSIATQTAAAPPTAVPATNTPLPTPSAATINAPADLALLPSTIFIYPVPTIYTGDVATFQFVAHVPREVKPEEVQVSIRVNGQPIVEGALGGRNLGGDTIGLFEWAWNTADLIGDQTVEFALDPNDTIQLGDDDPSNNYVSRIVTIQPRSNLTKAEAEASWITRETSYAFIHVVSGTAAHRDLDQLATLTDTAIAKAVEKLTEVPNRKFDVYYIDRVIGQGGYAGGSMVVSYLDRNYSGGGLSEVVVHETVHLLDFQFAPRRITFLAEGVAVWATGGHYKQENLNARAAALVETGLYIPLAQLADNFYPVQHEIGYLEAAAFVNYLVGQYGWTAVKGFYADTSTQGYNSVSAALDAKLQSHFNKSLTQIEQEWLVFLAQQPYDRDAVPDLLATVRFYNVMRDYQTRYDPTAHFLTAWLPSPQQALELGYTATFTRHPEEEINIVLETMLAAADQAMRAADYQNAKVIIDSVERVLQANGNFADPLSVSYRDIVRKATSAGYEVQRIEMDGAHAAVFVTQPNRTPLIQLDFSRTQNAWILLR